jgi:predicted transport protein
MDKLITSSLTTLQWLDKIASEIKKRIPHLTYGNAKYVAFFKNPQTNRNIVYLQPQKKQIRVYLRLNLSDDTYLQRTPISGNWAEMYPSFFITSSESMIEKAIELIMKSYKHDLRL